MIDPLSVALGAVAVLAGFVAGRRSRPTRQSPQQVRPICACKHHYGEHDDQDGCVAKIEQSRYDPSSGNHRGWDWVQCPCLRYTGPLPITAYLAPEILGER